MQQDPRLHSLRMPVRAAACLVGFVLVLTATAQLTGLGAWRAPVAAASETKLLRFVDREDGAVLVYDDASGALAWTYGAGAHGFVRGALRAVAHERKVAEMPADAPFEISRHADGKLTIVDPLTGARVILNGFGAPNAAEFEVLFEESAG